MDKETFGQNLRLQDATLFFLRVIIAIIFLFAAWAKWKFLSAGAEGLGTAMKNLLWFLVVVEPLGALALLVGFLARWAAAGLALIMLGAIWSLFSMGTAFFTGPQATGFDYNVLILGGCLIVIAFGAGTWSLDGVWR